MIVGAESSVGATLPEDETQLARLADPFAGIFRVIDIMTIVLATQILVIAGLGFCLYRNASQGTAHVYEVHSDGSSTYVGSRDAHLLPRPQEAVYVAKQFIKLLYAYNSSTVDADIAAAVSMCEETFAGEMRRRAAEAKDIATIREGNLRSELTFLDAKSIEHGRNTSRATIRIRVDNYGLTQYDGNPFQQTELTFEVAMITVPRDPDRRPNGLEVIRYSVLDRKLATGR